MIEIWCLYKFRSLSFAYKFSQFSLFQSFIASLSGSSIISLLKCFPVIHSFFHHSDSFPLPFSSFISLLVSALPFSFLFLATFFTFIFCIIFVAIWIECGGFIVIVRHLRPIVWHFLFNDGRQWGEVCSRRWQEYNGLTLWRSSQGLAKGGLGGLVGWRD